LILSHSVQVTASPSFNHPLPSREKKFALSAAIKHKPGEEGMQKNGLSATPSSAPPWSARPEEKFTSVRFGKASSYNYSCRHYKPASGGQAFLCSFSSHYATIGLTLAQERNLLFYYNA
jgi:hypothetical protein